MVKVLYTKNVDILKLRPSKTLAMLVIKGIESQLQTIVPMWEVTLMWCPELVLNQNITLWPKLLVR